MKLLVVNAGSSSLKFQMFEMPSKDVLISGLFERIGIEGSKYTLKINEEKIEVNVDLPNHEVSFKFLVEELLKNNIVKSLDEIKAVGHRVVQGGDFYDKSVIINHEVLDKINELSSLAPLHNPAAIVGIEATMRVIPQAINVAVFDTSFHQTMEEENYMYAVPKSWYDEYKVRRYGAHGTSHKYISERVSAISDANKIIVCHLGNGGSITAIKDKKCVNTSMGLTPNAGLIMGTRCGDIDATIIPYMMNKTGMSASEIDNALNKQSGLLAISNLSSDSRDIENSAKEGNKDCLLAQTMFVKRVVDYIAKYYVELDGVDAICFTAGIGENSCSTRTEILKRLKVLGVTIDCENNKLRGKEILISGVDSSIKCFVIPTNEELMIAIDTFDLMN